MFRLLKAFFVEASPTIEGAFEKADQLGEDWSVEKTAEGLTVKGIDAYGEPASWQFQGEKAPEANYLLDHALSVRAREAIWQERYPEDTDDAEEMCRRKHEIRDEVTDIYFGQAYKPGWKQLLEKVRGR